MESIRLEFSLSNPTNNNTSKNVLKYGKLTLKFNGNSIAYSATSGIAGYQELASAKVRAKGRIPTCKQLAIDNYTLHLDAINLPNVKGVEGLFYRITPFKFTVDGVQRSDVGIHFDANIPGSAGCIVIKQLDHWESFKKAMKNIALSGNKSIPLYVY